MLTKELIEMLDEAETLCNDMTELCKRGNAIPAIMAAVMLIQSIREIVPLEVRKVENLLEEVGKVYG